MTYISKHRKQPATNRQNWKLTVNQYDNTIPKINTHHKNHNNPVNQWFKQSKTSGKHTLPAKMNNIDNQPLTSQNIGNNRQQTGKTCKAVNLFQDNK